MDECTPLARGEAAAARDALSSTAAEGADGLKAVRAALALREREVEHSRREAGPCSRLSLHLALDPIKSTSLVSNYRVEWYQVR